MLKGRRIIAPILGVLVIASAGYADMFPVSAVDIGCRQSPAVCGSSLLLPANSSSLFDYPDITVPDLRHIKFLPKANADAGQTSQVQAPLTLTNGPDSLALCLSALMGLGLCSSVHWIRRLSFGFVPQWYHDGGPFQIGHSHAIMPNSLCPVRTCCFIQPVGTAEDSLAQYRLRAGMSVWRKSRLTRGALVSRGPPRT
jgi:hypothetical protein